MKNYYEILEVDKNASQEVIEKAYKTLAKKYHPDLQQGQVQNEYAEKMKNINQAYDVLSNPEKREEYNNKLESEKKQTETIPNETMSKEQQERIIRENYELKQKMNRMQSNNHAYDEGTIYNMSRILNQQINVARKQAYHDAYIKDLQNRGYRIKYKHSLKYYLKAISIIIIVIFLCFLIYQIPFVKNYFINLYNENVIFKTVVEIFKKTFSNTF